MPHPEKPLPLCFAPMKHSLMARRWPVLVSLLFWLMAPTTSSFAAERILELADGNEISSEVYAAQGDRLLVWLPSEFGLSPRQGSTARTLNELGIEVWIPDLHSAWFITPGRYSLNEVDPEAVQRLIEQAMQTGKQVFLLSSGRVNVLALHAVRRLQSSGSTTEQLRGLISISPRLFLTTPQGGEEAVFLPIVNASNLPIFVLQPQNAGGFWRIGRTIEELEKGGAPVYLQRLPNVGDGFNLRSEFTAEEETATKELPRFIDTAMRLLNTHGGTPRVAAPMAGDEIKPQAPRGGELLRPYPGERQAPALELPTLDGKQVDLKDLRGKVVLVNFWATWCPPCVEEIPSLQRLYARTRAQGLEILAVDVGEDEATMRAFLADKPIDFPVLMDTEGSALKRWGVHAFPTTLILDRQHRIRYAVFGAFAWDSEEVLTALKPLLKP